MSDGAYHVYVLSNTHWDREWYMSQEKYLARLCRMFDRLLVIMESQGDYIFVTDGQYMMVEDYLSVRPENRERITRLVTEGRLKIGPWYTQPLETLISGEAMIRNLQYGIQASEKLGGAMKVSYEIDEFGHASQTPQVLGGFGIDSAIAWRGMYKNTKSAFLWSSPDGSDVWMFYSNDGYGEATTFPTSTEDFDEEIDGKVYRRSGIVSRVDRLLKLRTPNADTNCLMWLNGIDHSWAQPDVLDAIRKTNELFPDLHMKQATCEEFVAAVRADYEARKLPLQHFTGELMATREDVLSSTHSGHPRQKLKHYKTERYLERMLEPSAAFSWLCGEEYPRWAVDRAWKYVLQNHAHDSLGCCSVDEVYEQVMARYGCAYSLAEQITEESLRAVMSRGADGNAVYLFNTSPFVQKGVIPFSLEIPEGIGDQNFVLTAPDGKEAAHIILSQYKIRDIRYNPRRGHPTVCPGVHVDLLCDIPEVPAFGYLRLQMTPAGRCLMRGNRRMFYYATGSARMENRYLAVTVNPNGTADITDKITGKTYPSQFLFEDGGEAGNAYVHLSPASDRLLTTTAANASVALLYDTPLGCAYEIRTEMKVPGSLNDMRTARSAYGSTVEIRTVLSLKKDARRLDAEISICNHAESHRLRVLFPTEMPGAEVSRGGQPFDVVERPIHEELDPELREQPYATHPMQDFCDVSDGTNGLSVACGGIYEYEVTDNAERAVALTLLRANDVIDQGFVGNPRYVLHEAQTKDKELTYHLSLLPHDGDWRAVYGDISGAVAPLSAVLKRAPEISTLTDYQKPEQTLPDGGALMKLAGTNLMMTVVKHSLKRDTLIVRVLNYGTEEAAGKLTYALPLGKVLQVYETNLNEERQREITYDGAVQFSLRKAGMITFEFVIA